MRRVPRHEFVPSNLRGMAYADGPLPIGDGQTISQPFIVASMTEALNLSHGMKVLEVGTGSGYQAAILAEMGMNVFTIEYIPRLQALARKRLEDSGYTDIQYQCGDGCLGWPEEAPFDAIIVTAAPVEVPRALADQLREKGRLVIPLGLSEQTLHVYLKTEDGSLSGKNLYAVRFVPLVGG